MVKVHGRPATPPLSPAPSSLQKRASIPAAAALTVKGDPCSSPPSSPSTRTSYFPAFLRWSEQLSVPSLWSTMSPTTSSASGCAPRPGLTRVATQWKAYPDVARGE